MGARCRKFESCHLDQKERIPVWVSSPFLSRLQNDELRKGEAFSRVLRLCKVGQAPPSRKTKVPSLVTSTKKQGVGNCLLPAFPLYVLVTMNFEKAKPFPGFCACAKSDKHHLRAKPKFESCHLDQKERITRLGIRPILPYIYPYITLFALFYNNIALLDIKLGLVYNDCTL